jgi:hypothetical protein
MLVDHVVVERCVLRLTCVAATAVALCGRARCEDLQIDGGKGSGRSQMVARIFASWKARQDQTKSFHFVWETFVVQHGEAVGNGQLPQSHCECWVDGDNRYRLEASTLGDAQAKSVVRHEWTAFDRETYSSLSWTEGSRLPARGKHWNFGRKHPGFVNNELRPLTLVFRPLDPRNRRPERYRLATEDAIVNGVRCIKLQSIARPGDLVESLWADPRQGDVLVFWEVRAGQAQFPPISLQYQADHEKRFIPIVWRTGSPDGRPLDLLSKVKTFSINEKLPADAFHIHFPLGTAVAVDLEGKDNEQYYVKPDGSKEIVFNLDSIHSPQLHKLLEQRTNFTFEPMSLRDAVRFLNSTTAAGNPIVIDERAFREAKIDPSIVVSEGAAGRRFWEVLGGLSAECPKPFRAYPRTFAVRRATMAN